MIQKNKIAISIILIMLCAAKQLNAQWLTNGVPSGNNFHQTDPGLNIESIGIGDFGGLGLFPQSALHINTILLPSAQPDFQPGEVFRTDCPIDDAISTYWRMLRGGVEYGTIYNLSVGQDYTNTGTGQGLHFYLQLI